MQHKQSIYYSTGPLYMFRVSTTHKTVTRASGIGHIFCAATKNMSSTGGCSYSFVYS